MDSFEEAMRNTRDMMTVKRVFGEPIERDGVTFIAVASIGGGGGGGSGEGTDDEGESGKGTGGGFGVKARPVGAYVIRNGEVDWEPAIDVAKLGMAGIALAGLMAAILGCVLKSHRHSHR